MAADSYFVWADLSSYDTAASERFYGAVLGWRFDDSGFLDGYRLAMVGGAPVAAIYKMPDKFARINMPPFWMPYIAVPNAAKTAKVASDNGGKVEVMENLGNGKMALIRDPSGAGFSIYDGGDIALSGAGIIADYELFVPDAEVVRGFYENTFNWQLTPDDENNSEWGYESAGGRFHLIDENDNYIASIQEAADDIRGNKQYWTIHFATDNLENTKASITKNGGQTSENHTPTTTFATSPTGEFFIISQS